MIRFEAALWVWAGSNGTWHFVTVPKEQSGEIRAHAAMALRGFRSARVEARIEDVTWRTSVFPEKDGGYILPVKAEVRLKAGIVDGETITVELTLL